MTSTTPRILRSLLFGDHSRYKVVEFQTRFGGVEFQVSDAEVLDDECGMPQIIRQEPTLSAALDGLDIDDSGRLALAAGGWNA